MKFRSALAILALGGIVSVVTAANASAQDGAAPGSSGDAQRGKVLAYTCHGCHGVPNYKNAYPNYSVPKLGGQGATYLAAALKAYAAGERPHATMNSQATTLSDQDRADIAAYLQSEAVQGGEVKGTPPTATQTCVACHGDGGAKPIQPDYPVLAGQYADYIVQALKDYKAGRRKNAVMAGIVAGIDEKDFDALGQFFENQRGLCSTEDIKQHGKCQAE